MIAEKPERVTLHSTDVQGNFRAVVNQAAAGHEHIIVERDGLPVIAMLSVAEYQLLMREREQREERLQKFEATARRIGQAITLPSLMAKLPTQIGLLVTLLT